jgi:hypothetical protein
MTDQDAIEIERYGGFRGWHGKDDFYVARWDTTWEFGTLEDIPVIVLPHQCDDWVIGDSDQARKLIADLEQLIEQGPPDG